MPNRKNAQDTWERILESAETLFARQGYSGTSTRQIATEAGVSIQTLQYHCGGKNNLYKKVLERTVIPVTDLINRYVQKMVEQDLTDVRVLEESVARIIDELFDLLHAHPNYAPLFYRQWLVQDPDLRSVEWENLTPVFRQWSKEVEAQLDEERLRDTNLFLLFMSLSWSYWGLFVQPSFIARYMGIDPDSAEFLRIVKDHAWEMTLRMMEQRRSSSTSPFKKSKTKAGRKGS
jgi:AcrR family transcriptional regulator